MIPIAKPYFGEEEISAASEVIRSGWVTQGPKVAEFENQFASYVGAQYACAVSSCTTALHLALLAAGVKPGDVVLTVSHSFIATANAIRHCWAEPVFIDIEPNSENIDPDQLSNCLLQACEEMNGVLYYKHMNRLIVGESPLCYLDNPKGRVAAILAVHQMGMPCDLKRLVALSHEYGIPLVEDAACAVGSEITLDHGATWEKIGKPHGLVSCFSFHPRKILTTGDGGMITTNSKGLLEKFKLWRHHGMSTSDTVRHEADRVAIEQYETTGFNYRMTDIQAAVGIEQLKKLNEHVARRRELAAFYQEILADNIAYTPPQVADDVRTNWQSYPIRLKPGYDRDRIMQLLLDQKIATRQGIMNSHEERPYLPAKWHLPICEQVRRESLLIPFYPQLRRTDQEQIAAILNQAVQSCILPNATII